jgi:hypothetical protein
MTRHGWVKRPRGEGSLVREGVVDRQVTALL